MSNISDQNKHKKQQLKGEQLLIPPQKYSSLAFDRRILAGQGYYVGRKLDAGTFATVRYAEKTNGGESLAVKIIDKSKISPLYSKFLMRELGIWPKLHHRHIIQVENIYTIQDRVYVFMELAPRGSVIEYLQTKGAVNENLGRDWCKRMFQALRYCHIRGIAHRDLKCDNLLLDKDLAIKIGDFGFCCYGVDQYRGSRIYSQTYCGSSSYVAPEVIEAKSYDPIIADVWSAGVCMFVILNNTMPFDDSNIIKMHDDQVNQRWRFPESASKLSPNSKKLMVRMLDPNVQNRPTMDQVLNTAWIRQK